MLKPGRAGSSECSVSREECWDETQALERGNSWTVSRARQRIGKRSWHGLLFLPRYLRRHRRHQRRHHRTPVHRPSWRRPCIARTQRLACARVSRHGKIPARLGSWVRPAQHRQPTPRVVQPEVLHATMSRRTQWRTHKQNTPCLAGLFFAIGVIFFVPSRKVCLLPTVLSPDSHTCMRGSLSAHGISLHAGYHGCAGCRGAGCGASERLVV